MNKLQRPVICSSWRGLLPDVPKWVPGRVRRGPPYLSRFALIMNHIKDLKMCSWIY